MNNLSYIIVLFLFAGVVWVGLENRENIKQIALNEEAQLELEQEAREQAIKDAGELKDKFIREISHDRDPETNLFEVKLQAISADAENDEMSYKWEQVPVSMIILVVIWLNYLLMINQ